MAGASFPRSTRARPVPAGSASFTISSATRLKSPDSEGRTDGPEVSSHATFADLDEAAMPGLRHGRLFAGGHPPAMCRPASRPPEAEGQADESGQPGGPARDGRRAGRDRDRRDGLACGKPIRFDRELGPSWPGGRPEALAGCEAWACRCRVRPMRASKDRPMGRATSTQGLAAVEDVRRGRANVAAAVLVRENQFRFGSYDGFRSLTLRFDVR